MIHMSQFFLGYSDFVLTDQYTEINFHDSHESVFFLGYSDFVLTDQYTDSHESVVRKLIGILFTDQYTEMNFHDLHVSFRFMV